MKATIVIDLGSENIDRNYDLASIMSWLEELADKAREYGEIVQFDVEDIPSKISML